MKLSRAHLCFLTLLVLLVALPGCRTAPPKDSAIHPSPPPELVDRSYLFEIARHLYRWQLDEGEIERLLPQKQIVFWVARLEPKLDPGDQSILGEILLPQLAI